MVTAEHINTEQQCIESAKRGAAWLSAQQGPNGAWKTVPDAPVDAYYKVGAALSLMGEATAAERLFDYVKGHLLQADGDFLPRGNPWHTDVHYQYANGWFVIGAQKQGRYDIAMPALRFLLSQQDPDHGGFYSLKAPAGEKTRSDTMSTGISGVACLATGQMAAAKRVADHFEQMIELQPAPEDRFYMTVEADGHLGTAFPEDETFWRVINTKQKDQCMYAVGLPFTFLILLHQATGEEHYAELAQWYLDFQLRCVNPWDKTGMGKGAWGCSILYRLTGEQRYRDIALHVARIFLGRKSPAGWFVRGGQPAYGQTGPDDQQRAFIAGDFDGNAEMTVWLGLIGSNLLARDITG